MLVCAGSDAVVGPQGRRLAGSQP